jgi:Tfp pilus assembly protein PilO
VKERLKKGGVLHLFGALFALSAVSYFLVFAPKLREVQRLKEDVEARQAGMDSALRLWGRMASTGGEESRRWEEQAKAWRERVPETPETDGLMAEVARNVVLHNLKGFRLSIPADGKAEKSGTVEGPGASAEGTAQEKNASAEEIRLRLSFSSTYRDMAEFVDGIPRMKRLLSIRSVVVKEREGEMETTLELSAFYRKAK